ncbi:DEAD/DEAH box helicase [Bordetella pertussis]|nr:DEAD/DEAH box helicase [Bordetella pertussis]
MELIGNISRLLGDDFKQTIRPGARVRIAASSSESPRKNLDIRGPKSE